jgi:small-conductance mechanosensitive channel
MNKFIFDYNARLFSFIELIKLKISGIISFDLLYKIASTLLIILVIIIIFNLIQLLLGRLLKKRLTQQRIFLLKKIIQYTGFVICIVYLFKNIGLDTSTLLGAAGIVGIAVGFAAQTSVSSIISGFFLLSEKPFQVGDTIKVNDVLGQVLSVDLLSVKLRTFDNFYIRIPNETILKSNVINLNRFLVRRQDIVFSVTYDTDLEKLRDILMDIAAKNPYVLVNPPPVFRVEQFDRAGIGIIFNVWFDKNMVLETKTSMYMEIRKRFAEEGIEIPYQKVDVKVSDESGITSP